MLVNVLRWCHIITSNDKSLVMLLTIHFVSLFLSLGYDSLFPCLHVWVSFQSCVQSKLVFHYVSSDVPYFPVVLISSFFLLFVSESMQIECNDLLILRHHDSLTILIHFIPLFLALC